MDEGANKNTEENIGKNTPEKIRRKIIYVDDISFGLITVKNKLKDRYEVFPAQSTAILFDILQHMSPDLILLDIKMPGTDGYNVLHMLREDGRYAGIPVIFVTSKSDKESVDKGISLGAAAYICKPFTTELLIETIEGVLDPDKQRHGGSGGHEETGDNRPCILAVDDVTSMLRAIHYALRDKYKVHTLSDPTELKDLLREVTPDLFLLDYKMPAMNGFELIPVIREFPEHKETPIMFLTSESPADLLAAAFNLGVCDYIVKPFEPKSLHEKIEKHLK
jgi:PleD family two-component response regulator